MMKKVEFFSLVIVLLLLSQQINCTQSLNDATSILDSLIQDSENKLKDHKNFWEVNSQLFQESLNSIQSSQREQQQECDLLSSILSESQKEQKSAQDYLEWITNKLVENQQKSESLSDNRCVSAKLYVESLKHNKIALSLIEFLRAAIQSKDEISLVQRQQIIYNLNIFVSMYSDNKIKEMIKAQLGQDEFTSFEENKQDEFEVEQYDSSERRSWPEYKAELLELLNTLEDQIKIQMDRAQEDEVNSGITLSEFLIQIEKENIQLAKYKLEYEDKLAKLEVQIIEETNQAQVCDQQQKLVDEEYRVAQEQYQEQENLFETRKQAIVDEIGTLQYVLRMYQDAIGNDNDTLNRIQDYQDDNKFSDSKSSREIDSFERLTF